MGGDVDPASALAVAQEAARRAGSIQREYRSKNFSVRHKGEIDLVTGVDIACEEEIVRVIRRAFPEHDVLAEEGEATERGSRYTWLIDPLDGTVNYAHGFPIYCASVALADGKGPVAGAVYDPERDEMFTATRGGGAFLNGEGIKVSGVSRLTDALLATGFPYTIRTTEKNNLKEFADFAMRAQALRRPGAAAIDLCYVACGRLEGFWEFHLKPWDMAAGALIVEEAGGKVTDSGGGSFDPFRQDIVASNGLVHSAMLETLALP